MCDMDKNSSQKENTELADGARSLANLQRSESVNSKFAVTVGVVGTGSAGQEEENGCSMDGRHDRVLGHNPLQLLRRVDAADTLILYQSFEIWTIHHHQCFQRELFVGILEQRTGTQVWNFPRPLWWSHQDLPSARLAFFA